jgi:chitodextrinase
MQMRIQFAMFSLTLFLAACVEVAPDNPPQLPGTGTDILVDAGSTDIQAPPTDVVAPPDALPPEDTFEPQDTAPPLDEVPPSWPEDAMISVVTVNENGLTLTWTRAEDDSGIKSYHVYQDDVMLTKLSDEHQALQINQLSPGSTYTFRVEAEDILGNVSENGPSLSVDTTDNTAPTWPEDSALGVDSVTHEGLSLSWSEAIDNVAITTYRVYRDNVEIASTEAQVTSVQVADLFPWTTYTFRVEAEDAHGNLSSGGPTSTAQTTDIVSPIWPEQATLLASQITPNGCYLGWDMAIDNVEVTAYQVLQDKVEIATLASDTTWVKVVELAPWTTYGFEIYALDAAGNQTSSPLGVEVSTPDEVAPMWSENSAIIASDPTDSSVTLAWNGASDDVAVTGYRLYQDNVEIGLFDAATVSTDVADLSNMASYIFRVEAEDAAGNLSFGGPVLAMDLSDKTPPVWPIDASLSAIESAATSVTLSWTEATDNAGVAGYQILENDQVVASVPGNETMVTVASLSPLTTYNFAVVASDSAGNSTDGGPTLQITTPDYPEPIWPDDASLEAPDVSATSANLTWTDIGMDVTVYTIFQDDQLVLSVPAPGLSGTVTGLTALTTYGFRVEAEGPSGKTSTSGPSLSVTTMDLTPPDWPGNASLLSSDLTETSLTLTWTALHDSQNVVTYNVHKNGVLLGTVDAPEHTINVIGLTLGETITFKVEAVGPTGQVSDDGPGTTVTLSDVTGPAWDANASLTLDAVTDTTATLSWTGATDNVAVTGYEVFVDGESDGTVGGNVTTYVVEGLASGTTYDFQVQAMDGAGNSSVDGPSAQGATNGAAQAVTEQDVLDALQPTCSACHSGWFASVQNFQTHVSKNANVVVPGDPDGSLLVLYLEENGPGSGQMPPSFFDPEGDSFMDMSDKGETALTVEEIRSWIEGM